MAARALSLVAPGASSAGHMADVRRGNLALVLMRISEGLPTVHPSRAQLAAITGLTKASVSSLVLDLLQVGLVREVGLNQQGRGRPSVGLEVNRNKAVLGAEINVDYVAVGLVDLAGNLVAHQVLDCDNRNADPARVMATLSEQITSLGEVAEEMGIDLLGVGLAVPGLVNPSALEVVSAPNLGWKQAKLDLYSVLPEFPAGVMLCNEANAAALAEMAQDPDIDSDFLLVSGEVGVGGGLIVGRELFTGLGGHAGEVGHIVVAPEGPECSCGGRGCLETVAGQDAIADAAGLSGHPARGSRSETMSVLLQALDDGNEEARSAVARAGFCLGLALASSVRVVPFESVVLGGHFAVLEPWMRGSLLGSLQRYAPGKLSSEKVLVSVMGQSGALRGAADLVVRSIIEAPHVLLT